MLSGLASVGGQGAVLGGIIDEGQTSSLTFSLFFIDSFAVLLFFNFFVFAFFVDSSFFGAVGLEGLSCWLRVIIQLRFVVGDEG